MLAASRKARGKSGSRLPPSIVHDAGGLVVGRSIEAPRAPGPRLIAGRNEEHPGAAIAPLSPAAVAAVVGIAARAPSVHNTQPWKFRVAGDVVELSADPDRLLIQIDPAGRELMISCGAALFGLRLGMRQVGRIPAVQLRPDPAQPWLLARAWPAEYAAANTAEAELLAAVPHRHTHRGQFSPGEVAPRLLAALAVDAAAEGAELKFIESPRLVSGLAELVDRAARDQDASAAITAETRRWLRPDGSQARDGVPAWSAADGGELPAQRARQRLRQRFRQQRYGWHPAAQSLEPAGGPPAATAVLITDADTPADWLRAGQALNRLLLRAATRWVFASLQSQPLESPRYRDRVRDLLDLQGQPQMLLQFGRSNSALATPRRRQDEYRSNETGP